jgi:hypothetical protein
VPRGRSSYVRRADIRPPGLAASLAAVSLLAACNGAERPVDSEEPSPDQASLAEVVAAAERTVEAGASAMTAEVGNRAVGYRLTGRVDFAAGYRACARIDEVHGSRGHRFLAGGLLWLAGAEGTITYGDRRGSWDHVIKGVLPGDRPPRCARGGGWFDDHPPTLELFRPRGVAGGLTGAESYLHLAMMAITRLREGALRVVPADRSQAVQVEIDFGRYDEEPPSRDEDAWEVRPLLRRARTLPVTVTVDQAERLTGIDLAAPSTVRRGPAAPPVRVSLALTRLGEPRSVPEVVVTAIE